MSAIHIVEHLFSLSLKKERKKEPPQPGGPRVLLPSSCALAHGGGMNEGRETPEILTDDFDA